MPVAHEPVELGEARARPAVVDRALVDVEQARLELAVVGAQLAEAEQLRVVGTSSRRRRPRSRTASARPRLHRQVAGRGERLDPGPRPDEREAERELDLALPARALAVHEALPDRGGLALLHPGPELAAHVLHRGGADLVREPHPLDLLRRLDRARGVRAPASRRARPATRRTSAFVNVVGSPTIRSDACVPERQLEADAAVVRRRRERRVERARRHRPRIVVARSRARSGRRSSTPMRAASSSDASRQISTGSPSRGKTHAS